MTLTVLGSSHSRAGAEFTYLGETDPECASCKLRKTCQNLDANRAYRVKKVRPVEHKDVCHVFEGTVKVVEVEEIPIRVAVPASAARGTGWTNRFEECGASCLLKRYCNPAALPHGSGARGAFVKIDGPVECKVGRDLRYATVTLE